MGLECKICFGNLDTDDRMSMNLIYCHTICMRCVAQLIVSNPICSLCRKQFPLNDIGEIPIAFSLLEMCVGSNDSKFFESGKVSWKNLKFDHKYSDGSCEEHGEYPPSNLVLPII